ncbi:hypothetical protein [Methylosinus sp. Sm6]|uniref:hypothetical protein n=1 Tax=Methylosinus sp. Sm6 TaxID=2866948 RepID=UPI001C992071|nr:hypothetical protein [Methylosinus sp. Sm6]MBY6241463.1 hypothetical protein [Methylosinus sp. Sm6]
MNLMKTLTIGAAALGWLSLAGQASAASPSSPSKEEKYAAATSYESSGRSYHPSKSGRSAYAPRGMETRCQSKGGRLIHERGGDWRCVMRGGRSVYTTKGGRIIHAPPRGREIYQERGVKAGRSVYQPRSGRSNEMRERQGNPSAQERSIRSPRGAAPQGAQPSR